MNIIILSLLIVTAIASPSGALGILTGVGLIYCMEPNTVKDKFKKWSWTDLRV